MEDVASWVQFNIGIEILWYLELEIGQFRNEDLQAHIRLFIFQSYDKNSTSTLHNLSWVRLENDFAHHPPTTTINI